VEDPMRYGFSRTPHSTVKIRRPLSELNQAFHSGERCEAELHPFSCPVQSICRECHERSGDRGGRGGSKDRDRKLNNLRYADDIKLLAGDEESMNVQFGEIGQ